MKPKEKLLADARVISDQAYAPYSGFAVGAALLLDDGRIITGCNFENASTGLGLCAETVALARANCEGDLARVVEVAIVGGAISPDGIIGTEPCRPCGRCRQVLNEAAQLAGRDLLIHCQSADGQVTETHRLSDLLPFAFGPADLMLTGKGPGAPQPQEATKRA